MEYKIYRGDYKKLFKKEKNINSYIPILLLIYLEIILNGYNYSKVEEDKNQQTNWISFSSHENYL
jgi:hypothetical protein